MSSAAMWGGGQPLGHQAQDFDLSISRSVVSALLKQFPLTADHDALTQRQQWWYLLGDALDGLGC